MFHSNLSKVNEQKIEDIGNKDRSIYFEKKRYQLNTWKKICGVNY